MINYYKLNTMIPSSYSLLWQFTMNKIVRIFRILFLNYDFKSNLKLDTKSNTIIVN